MRFAEALRVALQAVAANRLRAALTTLGVVIGVMAVVLLVAIGQGARQEITGAIEGLGSNLLIVVPGSLDPNAPPARSEFELEDVERIGRALGDHNRVSAQAAAGDFVRVGTRQTFATLLGVTESYPDVVDRKLDRGQFLTASDVLSGRRVAVIGSSIADDLFPGEDPVGKTITIAGLRFRVVGLLREVGPLLLGPDRDTQIWLPITAAHRILNTQRVDSLFVRARSTDSIEDDVARVKEALSRLDPETYSVLTQDEIIGVIGDILELLTLVLAAIAGISLLVGGVGVSNIMLVSVSERTREIGLRKALGARTRDITQQFLLEAVVLTGSGGLIGLALGMGFASLVAEYSPVPAVVTGWSVALALGVSIGVGIFFGVWPARRAGKLDPVVALRHE